jgi:Aspartyl protease
MPCVWGVHNRSQIFLDVGIIDAGTAATVTPGPYAPVIHNPPVFRALVDTGAEVTMISPNVASTVGLTPIGQIPIQGVGHTMTYHNAYLFHVAFVVPLAQMGPLIPAGGGVDTMIFMQPGPVYGGEITSSGDHFDVLLGMDVISTGSLAVEGNGTFSFSF